MEFEMDEMAIEAWLLDGDGVCGANHAPGWHADRGGGQQTGVWIPEEGRAPTPRQRELAA